MREYSPGDRLRDINWKSSGRIDTLIIRISPDNREKITRIDIHFRNYGPDSANVHELWLLDRAKARLAWFLRNVKEEKASYVFHISSARRAWELNDQEETDAFLDELASLPFSPPMNEEPIPGAGGIYVFSTACDTGLPAFLLAKQGQPLTLFMAQNLPKGKGTNSAEPADCACLRLRDFPAGGFVPLPRWFLPRNNQLPVSSGGLRMTVDYAAVSRW